MTAQPGRLILAGLFFAVLQRPTWSAPAAYELLLAGESTVPSDRVAGLLERNLPQVAIVALLSAERYRQYAHFPVAACKGTEYFLLAHGKRLIAFGCFDDSTAAPELQKIRLALGRDSDTARESSKEALFDGALHSAAAGNWPAAWRYAGSDRSGPRAVADFEARLQRVLNRQRSQ